MGGSNPIKAIAGSIFKSGGDAERAASGIRDTLGPSQTELDKERLKRKQKGRSSLLSGDEQGINSTSELKSTLG